MTEFPLLRGRLANSGEQADGMCSAFADGKAWSISNSPANRRGAAHGGGGVRYGFIEAPRQLHAERLRFTHPIDGSAAQINAPLPGESDGVGWVEY